MRLMQYPYVKMLLTPSNTPEFSPIENLFGYAKKKLIDLNFKSKEQVVKTVTDLMFSMDENRFVGFYRKTLNNMVRFWSYLKRSKILDNEIENISMNVMY
jgi:transposase